MTPACRKFFVFALALAALPVAAQSPGPAAAAAGECDRCGKIESIRPVTAKDLWTPLGSVSTTPLGEGTAATPSGVTMYQIGKGFSKQGTVVIGAAGGAAYRARPSELNAKRWEIVVRMEDGGTRAVTQNYEPMLREGDRVRVMGTQLELVQ
jgi:outer membrane lipoprotein SlyB